MNYRHAYHAGNFADVLKHAILARVICYAKQKAQPFRVIDSHAGAGIYDLAGTEAGKTGEWRDGIGRLLTAELPSAAAQLLAPYLDVVRATNARLGCTAGEPRFYPGSPLIARGLMRADDMLIANELHPEDAQALRQALGGAPASKVMTLNAWTALQSLLPPKERRGVILIDPPFEAADEFEALGSALRAALERFATGTYLVWYPIKDSARAAAFVSGVRDFAPKTLDVRHAVSVKTAGLGLAASGVLLVNPPFTLASELETLLPVLTDVLAEGPGAGYEIRSAE